MADLVLSGRWIGKKGLFKASVGSIRFLSSLDEIVITQNPIFLVVSYDISNLTTGIPIKTSGYPNIVSIEIKDLVGLRHSPMGYKINYKGSAVSDTGYKKAIDLIKQRISDGVIYQVNLTNKFDFEVDGDVLGLAVDFYQRQPVPYFFYLNHEGFTLISGSMELFLSRYGNVIKSMPIKGTSTNRKTLKQSTKDMAENLMITDMMRNDIGRVSEISSVSVPEIFKITKYKTLYQMHSTVVGICDKTINEILHCTFPPASVTGAPKIKAVEIIDSLEPHPRGYYCGCAGLVMPNGDFTLSVLIRTAYGKDNKISYFAGCGIVWDSDEDMELDEMYLKVRAFYPLYPSKNN
ncbi:MAG: anthranilate synthase component I family protein [Thermodesulfovibrionales bacterium]|nr:anthranilate synthase component I family protein [Thermodesulfovibrionales bacterium]